MCICYSTFTLPTLVSFSQVKTVILEPRGGGQLQAACASFVASAFHTRKPWGSVGIRGDPWGSVGIRGVLGTEVLGTVGLGRTQWVIFSAEKPQIHALIRM